MIEIKEPNREFKASLGTEVKTFIKSNIGGVEIKKEVKNVSTGNKYN